MQFSAIDSKGPMSSLYHHPLIQPISIESSHSGAVWPVGLPGDRQVEPPKIIITFLNFAIKWELVLFGRGPLLLP